MTHPAENEIIRGLESERHRLDNAVQHLLRSNAELRQAMDTQGDDEDRTFKTALEENIVVIARYRAQITRLDNELEELRIGFQNLAREQGNTAGVSVDLPIGAALQGSSRAQGDDIDAAGASLGRDSERDSDRGDGQGVYL